MESWPSRTQVTWRHLAPLLCRHVTYLCGYLKPRTPIQPPSKSVNGEYMLSRNPQPSSLADASPHTNPPHHCNAAIQPGTWPLRPASIHLIGTISWEPQGGLRTHEPLLTVSLLSVPMFQRLRNLQHGTASPVLGLVCAAEAMATGHCSYPRGMSAETSFRARDSTVTLATVPGPPWSCHQGASLTPADQAGCCFWSQKYGHKETGKRQSSKCGACERRTPLRAGRVFKPQHLGVEPHHQLPQWGGRLGGPSED